MNKSNIITLLDQEYYYYEHSFIYQLMISHIVNYYFGLYIKKDRWNYERVVLNVSSISFGKFKITYEEQFKK